MLERAARVVIVLSWITACADSDDPAGSTGTATNTVTGTATGSGTGTANGGSSGMGGGDTGGQAAGGGSGSGGSPPALPTCVLTCGAATDCATASVLTDADNWACTALRCKYLGCQSATECQQAFFNTAYVCEPSPSGLPVCTLSCTTSADCASGGELTDADNWSCTASRCEYLGCNSTAECQQALFNAAYTCEPGVGGALPSCVLGCTAATDCATASVLTDADNWSCDTGHCAYLGCNDATECQQALFNVDYVCE